MTLARVLSFSFIDSRGIPLDGGKLYTYEAGGTVEVLTYSDPDGETVNTNPILLNSRGCADVYIDTSKSYRFVVVNASNGKVEFFADKYSVASGGGQGGGSTIEHVSASVDNAVGTPSVDVEILDEGKELKFEFHNLRGEPGEKGETGLQGDKGDKGDTGARGAKGDRGEKGDKGDTGPQGPQGPKGADGSVLPTSYILVRNCEPFDINVDGYRIVFTLVDCVSNGISYDKTERYISLKRGVYSISYVVEIRSLEVADTIDDINVAMVNVVSMMPIEPPHTYSYDSTIKKNRKFDCASQICVVTDDVINVSLGATYTGNGYYYVKTISLSIMKIG